MDSQNDDSASPVAHRSAWSRRAFLQRLLALGLSVPLTTSIIAACLGEGDPVDASPEPATPDPDEPMPAPGEATSSPDIAPTATMSATPVRVVPDPPPAGTIVIATVTGDTGIGNPILNRAIPGIEYYVFNRLFSFDDNGVLQPELATHWTYSADNLTLTISLAEATWHDGEAFDVDDVLFTFDTIQAETTETSRRSNLRVAGAYITWERVDDRTLTIITPEPSAPLLYQLSQIAVIPEHLLSGSTNINIDPFNTSPIGTGPYRLAEWEPGESLRLAAVAGHFQGVVRNAGLEYRFFATPEVAADALERGDIDMMFVPPQMHDQFEDRDDVSLYRYVYFTPVTLAFNHRHPLLQDVRVRRAISLAIDKAHIAEEVTAGHGSAAHHQFASTGPLDRYNDYEDVAALERDVAAANAVLDELGYEVGSNGIRMNAAGERLSFNLMTYSGFREYEAAQQLLSEMLAEIGVEATPLIVDYATLETLWTDPNDPPANRSLELHEWPHPFEFDPDVYNELHSDSFPPGYNIMWFRNDEVDDLIRRGRTTVNADERVAIYRELDRVRAELLPSLPLYNALDGWVVSNRIQGVRDSTYFRRYVLIGARDWFKNE
jgi:peptide/nickel transport system substrate-binding protein